MLQIQIFQHILQGADVMRKLGGQLLASPSRSQAEGESLCLEVRGSWRLLDTCKFMSLVLQAPRSSGAEGRSDSSLDPQGLEDTHLSKFTH